MSECSTGPSPADQQSRVTVQEVPEVRHAESHGLSIRSATSNEQSPAVTVSSEATLSNSGREVGAASYVL